MVCGSMVDVPTCVLQSIMLYSLSVKASSVLCVQYGMWIHGRCANMCVTQYYVIQLESKGQLCFVCTVWYVDPW